MTASRDWKRIAWARAFSSDMWLTPKNWLSPNSRRSIYAAFLVSSRATVWAAGRGTGVGARLRRQPGQPEAATLAALGRRLLARRAAVAGVGDHHRDHAVGL